MNSTSASYLSVLFLSLFILTPTHALPLTEGQEFERRLEDRASILPPGFRTQVCFGGGSDNNFPRTSVEACTALRDLLVKQRDESAKTTEGTSQAITVVASDDSLKWRESDKTVATAYGGQIETSAQDGLKCNLEIIGQINTGGPRPANSPAPRIV